MSTDLETHETYGVIGLGRVQCSPAVNLVGSSMKHSELIALRIYKADKEHRYGAEYFYQRETVAEVYLSKVQFTEMITSLNANSVPCTLQYINGERLGKCPEVNQREILQKDFENQLAELQKKIVVMEEAVKQVLNKPNITKSDKQSLVSSVQMLKQDIVNNIPYVRKRYDESIEKSLSLAKLELETCAKNLGFEPSKTLTETSDAE